MKASIVIIALMCMFLRNSNAAIMRSAPWVDTSAAALTSSNFIFTGNEYNREDSFNAKASSTCISTGDECNPEDSPNAGFAEELSLLQEGPSRDCPTYNSSGLLRDDPTPRGIYRLLFIGVNPSTGAACSSSCSGSLVDPEYILTAGHCISNGRGSNNFTIGDYCWVGNIGRGPAASGNTYGRVCRGNERADGFCPIDQQGVIINLAVQRNWHLFGNHNADVGIVQVKFPPTTNPGQLVDFQESGHPDDLCKMLPASFVAGYPGNDTRKQLCVNSFGKNWYRNTLYTGLYRAGVPICANGKAISGNTDTTFAKSVAYSALTCGGMSGGQLFDRSRGLLMGVHVAAYDDTYCDQGTGFGFAVVITNRYISDLERPNDDGAHIGAYVKGIIAEHRSGN